MQIRFTPSLNLLLFFPPLSLPSKFTNGSNLFRDGSQPFQVGRSARERFCEFSAGLSALLSLRHPFAQDSFSSANVKLLNQRASFLDSIDLGTN